MKSTHKVQRFNYSKIDSLPDKLQHYEFWGLHAKSGRIHIDTKRYKNVCEGCGMTTFMPAALFANRSTAYYIPSRVCRQDYAINIFRDFINNLKKDWYEEYKPLLDQIKSPRVIAEKVRVNEMMYTSDSEDLDEINFQATLAGFRRREKYIEIINSLYCQFILKVCTETDRVTLIVMSKLGYDKEGFSQKNFKDYSESLQYNKNIVKISELNNFNKYELLHCINNFLKHNSLSAYNKLLRCYPAYVCCPQNGTSNASYENGMYAGDWLILEDDFIEKTFDYLLEFFEDYCKRIVKEDVDRAHWDYDEYFLYAFNQMKSPAQYWGI